MKPRLLTSLFVLNVASAVFAEPINIGNRLELFLDDRLIAETQGLSRTQLRPEPKEVVLTCDAPWEGNTSGYFGVFQDGEIYRLYYRGWRHDPKTKKEIQPEVTCYAQSRNGTQFTKPELGVVEWKGSKANNIVWSGKGSHNFTAFRDPNGGFRALASSGFKRGLQAYESADGTTWKLTQKEPVITNGAFDSQNLAFWDAHRGEYRAYWRIFTNGVRAIRTATSSDFLTWENETDLTYPEGTPNEHLYTNAVQPYFRAPHLFIAFPTRYLPKQGQRVEPVLMSSRDGVHFHRWPDAVVPEDAPKDRAGNRSNYMAWGMVQLPGRPQEISVYATESYYGDYPGRLRRFVFRTDGFVALRGTGQATTKPLRVGGGRLLMNYVVRPGGSLRAELLDESGKVTAKSAPLSGEAIDGEVAWETPPNLTGVIRLRWVANDADVFSFRFAK